MDFLGSSGIGSIADSSAIARANESAMEPGILLGTMDRTLSTAAKHSAPAGLGDCQAGAAQVASKLIKVIHECHLASRLWRAADAAYAGEALPNPRQFRTAHASGVLNANPNGAAQDTGSEPASPDNEK